MAVDEFKEGRQSRYGYNDVDSGTFKTAASDSDTYTEISAEHFDIDRDLQGHDIPGSHGTRQVVHANTLTTPKGAMAKFTVSGPASIFQIDEYLYAFSQKVVEASTPFTKVFTPFSTHPDFSANAGHYLTWASGYAVNTTSWKATSCICTRIKFSIERNGWLMFEADWVSPTVPAVNSAVYESGTWEFGLDGPGGSDAQSSQYGYLHWSDLDRMSMDTDATPSPLAEGVVFHAMEFELGYEGVEGIHPDGSGGYNNIGLSGLFGNFSLTIQKDSISEGALTAQSGNLPVNMIIGWGVAGALQDGEFEAVIRGKFNPDGYAVDKEGLNKVVLSGTMSSANDSSDDMYQISLANSIDRSWPAA